MPVRADCVTIESGYDSRGNPGIWALANQACALTARAQAAPPGERFQLLQRSLELRQRELEAWTALGDEVGQSLACMGIGNVHFLTVQLNTLALTNTLEQARTWYARSEAHARTAAGRGVADAARQLQTVRGNALQLELFAATRLLHKQVRVRGLVNATHLNGRVGKCERLHSEAKYEVRLVASGEAPEVTVAIHERNLVVVREGE
jgi:hypothetical protein